MHYAPENGTVAELCLGVHRRRTPRPGDLPFRGVDGRLTHEDTPADQKARQDAARVLETQRESYSSLWVQLGVRYDGSPIIWPDGTPVPEDTYDRYVPSARPGGRAPHLWLSRTQSLFDVLGPGFTLRRMSSHVPWSRGASPGGSWGRDRQVPGVRL